MITPSRRRFLFGASALLMAPAIAGAESLMPISTLGHAPRYWGDGTHDDKPNLDWQLAQRDSIIRIESRPYYLHSGIVILPKRDTIYDFNKAPLHFKNCPDAYALDLRASPARSTVMNAHIIGHSPFPGAAILISDQHQIPHAFVEFD